MKKIHTFHIYLNKKETKITKEKLTLLCFETIQIVIFFVFLTALLYWL